MTTKLILLAMVVLANVSQLSAQTTCICERPSMFVDTKTVAERRHMYDSIKKPYAQRHFALQSAAPKYLNLDASFFKEVDAILKNLPQSSGIRLYFATYPKNKLVDPSDDYFPRGYEGALTVILVPTDSFPHSEGKPYPSGQNYPGQYKAIDINQNPQRGKLAAIKDKAAYQWIEGFSKGIKKFSRSEIPDDKESNSIWFGKNQIRDAASVVRCIGPDSCNILPAVNSIRLEWVSFSDKEAPKDELYQYKLSVVFLLVDSNGNEIDISRLPEKLFSGFDTGIPCPPDSCNDDPTN